jgi:DNA mismatch repair protein MutL
MPTIRQLSASVINKIAAGEVIERPASVVKELVENSVDAGAKRIEITIAKGGTELIRVTDNGCGIDAEQLELAVASHATSKIQNADDLFHVTSMGFRGEALASIAEVSQFRIRSRTAEGAAGAELEINGGSRSEIAPCGCGMGTTIEVRNLFFNTPVRRKFMRTVQTEMGHITEALTRIAMAHDDVHFVLTHNGRVVHDLPANTDMRSRVGVLFGREIAESLIWIDSGDGPVRVFGYVADPVHTRSHNRMQYVFLNRRHIRDRTLMHALTEAYRGLIMTGRYPIGFLRLEMPPDLVDVNVHPTKLEVRFQDSGQVYQKLLGTIRNRFLSSDLTAKASLNSSAARAESDTVESPRSEHDASRPVPPFVPFPSGALPKTATVLGHSSSVPSSAASQPHWLNRAPAGMSLPVVPAAGPLAQTQSPLAHHAAGDEGPWPSPHRGGGGPVEVPTEARNVEILDEEDRGERFEDASRSPQTQGSLGLAFDRNPLPERLSASMDLQNSGDGLEVEGSQEGMEAKNTGTTARTPEGAPALQVYNRYLITETEEGVAVIDQHALHERILYEQLRTKVLSSSLEVQRLLVPEPVQLSAQDAAAVLDHREELLQLGIEVDSFGGDTVIVSAYPAMLVNFRPAELLHEIAEQLQTPEKQTERRDLIDSLLHMMSCKAAIKAGDRLTSEEVSALIQYRHVVQDAHHCPHGRPTTLIFTRDELDRRFKRI